MSTLNIYIFKYIQQSKMSNQISVFNGDVKRVTMGGAFESLKHTRKDMQQTWTYKAKTVRGKEREERDTVTSL